MKKGEPASRARLFVDQVVDQISAAEKAAIKIRGWLPRTRSHRQIKSPCDKRCVPRSTDPVVGSIRNQDGLSDGLRSQPCRADASLDQLAIRRRDINR